MCKRSGRLPLLLSLAILSAGSAEAMGSQAGQSAHLLALDQLPSASATPMPYMAHLGIAAGVGIASVPLGLWLTNLVGNLSINLVGAAVPGLLMMGLFAPTVTALTAFLVGNLGLSEADGRFGFWLPWVSTVLVHVVATVVAGFAGVSLGAVPGLVVFSLVDGVLMGGSSVGMMRLLRRSAAAPTPVVFETHNPGESTVMMVPVSTVSF